MQRFEVTLEPVTGNWRGTPETRLKRGLKLLYRAFGLRCLNAKQTDTEQSQNAEQQQPQEVTHTNKPA